jgi:hypothetical protein
MAYSKISISNIALATLGADAIRSFDEGNKRAKQCEVFYEAVKNNLLMRFDWNFARVFAKLQKLEDIEMPINQYAYQLPADCKIVRGLYPRGSREWWEVVGKRFHCRFPDNAYIYYTKRADIPAEFTDTFANLLALGMAIKLSPSITQDSKLTSSLQQQFKVEERDAWEAEANEGNDYRAMDETPGYDTFVYPRQFYLPGVDNG